MSWLFSGVTCVGFTFGGVIAYPYRGRGVETFLPVGLGQSTGLLGHDLAITTVYRGAYRGYHATTYATASYFPYTTFPFTRFCMVSICGFHGNGVNFVKGRLYRVFGDPTMFFRVWVIGEIGGRDGVEITPEGHHGVGNFVGRPCLLLGGLQRDNVGKGFFHIWGQHACVHLGVACGATIFVKRLFFTIWDFALLCHWLWVLWTTRHFCCGFTFVNWAIIVGVFARATGHVATRFALNSIKIGRARAGVHLIQQTGGRRAIEPSDGVPITCGPYGLQRVEGKLVCNVGVGVVVARYLRLYGFRFVACRFVTLSGSTVVSSAFSVPASDLGGRSMVPDSSFGYTKMSS